MVAGDSMVPNVEQLGPLSRQSTRYGWSSVSHDLCECRDHASQCTQMPPLRAARCGHIFYFSTVGVGMAALSRGGAAKDRGFSMYVDASVVSFAASTRPISANGIGCDMSRCLQLIE